MTPVEELFQLLWDTPKDKLTWFAIKNRMLQKEKIYISEIYYNSFINATKGIEQEFNDYQKETFNNKQKMKRTLIIYNTGVTTQEESQHLLEILNCDDSTLWDNADHCGVQVFEVPTDNL